MSYQFQYIANLVRLMPRLPLLIRQGKQVRREVPQLPEAEKNKKAKAGTASSLMHIVLLGESTIAGVGVEDHRFGLAGQLAAQLAEDLDTAVQWEVIARSGYTARKVSDELVAKLPERAVELCVVGLGGNDTFEMTSPGRWQRDIRKLVARVRARQPDCPILFAQLPPVGQFPALTPLLQNVLGRQVELLHRALIEGVRALPKVYFPPHPIHFEAWVKKAPPGVGTGDFFSDGVHPSAVTYAVWGRELASFTRETIFTTTDYGSI